MNNINRNIDTNDMNLFGIDQWDMDIENDVIFGAFNDHFDQNGEIVEMVDDIEEEDAGNPLEFANLPEHYVEYSVDEHNAATEGLHDIQFKNVGNNTALEIWNYIFTESMFRDIASQCEKRRHDRERELRVFHSACKTYFFNIFSANQVLC